MDRGDQVKMMTVDGMKFILHVLAFTQDLNVGVTQFDPEFKDIDKGGRTLYDELRQSLCPLTSHVQSLNVGGTFTLNYSQYASYVGSGTAEFYLNDPTIDVSDVSDVIVMKGTELNGTTMKWAEFPMYKPDESGNPVLTVRVRFVRI